MIKTISTRIAQKHDLEANWLSFADFVPMQGELIIYDIEVDSTGKTLALPTGRTVPYTYERMKIGDGKTAVTALPFIVSEAEIDELATELAYTHPSSHPASMITGLGEMVNAEVANLNLITIDDIDAICGANIVAATTNEVTF
jgi:hypothetical protein